MVSGSSSLPSAPLCLPSIESVLLHKVFKRASRGAVIVCDRYPSRRIGAMDSPQLDIPEHNSKRLSIKHCLAKLENSIYKRIPPPDIVIKLTVPVEIALERNVLRAKKGKIEDDDFVKVRHLQSHKQKYLTEHEHTINTNKHLSDTILEVKHILWASI